MPRSTLVNINILTLCLFLNIYFLTCLTEYAFIANYKYKIKFNQKSIIKHKSIQFCRMRSSCLNGNKKTYSFQEILYYVTIQFAITCDYPSFTTMFYNFKTNIHLFYFKNIFPTMVRLVNLHPSILTNFLDFSSKN
jgi:hypothetical protein